MSRKVDCTIVVDVDTVREDQVAFVSVVQRMDAHHRFEFRLKLPDAERGTFTDKARAFLGKKAVVRINIAPQKPDSRDFSFEGIVTDVGFSRSQGGAPELAVSGMSASFLLDDGPRNRSFSEKGLAAIVQAVCDEVGSTDLKTAIAPKHGDALPYVVQYEETDQHFLGRLAARYGEWFYFDGTQLQFGQPATPQPEKLVFGQNLFSFDMGLALQRHTFSLRHWDHLHNKLLTTDETKGGEPQLFDDEYGKLIKEPLGTRFKPGGLEMVGHAADQADLDKRGQARRRGHAARAVVLRGVSDNARLRPGKTVKVTGPAAKDNSDSTTEYGEFLVTSVSHNSSNGNYQNHFEAIPVKNEMVPVWGGLHQPVCDPQVAVVKEVDDPERLGRVRVQFLWQQGGPELSPWIRVLSAHAHAAGGAYLVPEVNDEVLVDFEFNVPERPFVAGSLYTGKVKPDAAWVNDRNETKAFRTKGGNEVLISDKGGKESITIRNKDGKNEVVMALGGEPSITIRTDGKLTLDAKTLALKCQELEVDAQANGKIAAANLKIDGSALVEVKGGLIKLN